MNGLDGSAEVFNEHIDRMIKAKAKNKDKRLLLERGKEIGLIFDTETNRFRDPDTDDLEQEDE